MIEEKRTRDIPMLLTAYDWTGKEIYRRELIPPRAMFTLATLDDIPGFITEGCPEETVRVLIDLALHPKHPKP